MRFREVKKKVNLLGSPGVGKTSIILRYVKDVFGEKYLKTIGTSFYTKDVDVVGASVKLMIQDVMGEKSYETVHESTFKWSSGAIFVADASREETLKDILSYWVPRYKRIAGSENPIMLAVNKMDLENRETSKDYVLKEASNDFTHVFFTSAKTGESIDCAFRELASRVLFNTPKKAESLDDYLSKQTLKTPNDLLACLFTLSSSLDGLNYTELENLFDECGIDRFELEESLPEKKVFTFVEKLAEWCVLVNDKEGHDHIKSLYNRYKKEQN
ncbi:MAG: Rab family GTPase [Thermoplasmata archaeon]